MNHPGVEATSYTNIWGIFGECSQVSDKQLYEHIVAGAPAASSQAGGHEIFVADRAEVSLRTANSLGYRSRAEVLAYLGSHFRSMLPSSAGCDSDLEVRHSKASQVATL